MVGASYFNIGGNRYRNIGHVSINGTKFIFVQNGSDIRPLELKEIDGKISYTNPDKDKITNVEELKEVLLVEEIIRNFKDEISNGTIANKEELQERIALVQNTLSNDEYMKMIFDNNDIDTFKNNIGDIYKFFDDKNKNDEANLDLSNVSTFKIKDKDGNEKEYIKKYNEETNEVEVLVNQDQNRNFVEQFQDEQNKYASLNTEDGLKNAEETFDLLKDHEKVEVNLNKMNEVKEPNNITSYNAMNNGNVNNGERNLVADPDSNVYIDKNTGEVMTTEINGNNVSVKKVNEQQSSQTVEENVPVLKGEQIGEKNIVSKNGVTDEDLSVDEIEMLVVKYKDQLTDEQMQHYQQLLEQKQEEIKIEEAETLSLQEKPKQYVYKMEDKNAGYADLFVICSVTLFGVFSLIITVLTIFK